MTVRGVTDQPDANVTTTGSLIEQTDAAIRDLPVQNVPESVDQDQVEASQTGVARATTILALGNIASRLLGFVREILLSNYFGASRQNDALQIALTIPQDLYDLTISGHLNSALVPTLSEYAAKDPRSLRGLITALFVLLGGAAILITIALQIFTPSVIYLYRGAPTTHFSLFAADPLGQIRTCGLTPCGVEFTQEAFDLSVSLLRLTSPALVFLALFAVASASLYAMKLFTLPGFASTIFNAVVCLSILALVPIIGVEGAAIGWVIAAIAQFALQVFGMRRLSRGEPIRWRTLFVHPGIRRIGLLYLPVMFALVIDVAINRPFSYTLASQTGEGNIAYMNWATQLRQFPMGLVGTAISLAILPTLARQALSKETRDDFRNTLGQGIRLILTLIIPATVGIFVLAGPLIGLMFERGAFTAADTTITAQVLRLYLLGIPFAAVDLLLIFAFYAQQDSLTPALIGVFSLGCYIVLTLLLRPLLGFYALMVADSLKHLIHMLVSAVLLWRRIGGMRGQRLWITAGKVSAAALVMALITYLLVRSIPALVPVEGLQQRIVLVIVPSLFGGAMYFILASLLKLDEFMLFVRAVRRRIQRT